MDSGDGDEGPGSSRSTPSIRRSSSAASRDVSSISRRAWRRPADSCVLPARTQECGAGAVNRLLDYFHSQAMPS